MLQLLYRGSSTIDWCEGNYLYSPFIAEFANTISNALFLIFPPFLMHLFHPYACFINRGVHIVWTLLIVVGISSAYFHATLSMVGQLLDEIAILWLLMACFTLWFPVRFLPEMFQRSRKLFLCSIMTFSAFTTIMACLTPSINAFALMLFGIPSTTWLMMELRNCKDMLVYRLGVRCTVIWFIAVICWINDKLFCEIWSLLRFPYLHAAWHILVFMSGYTACVLFAYFHAVSTAPEQTPILHYWPTDKWEIGIPYVFLRTGHKRNKSYVVFETA